MKRLLIILISLTTCQLIACGSAYQLRLFPIGSADNKIIVVETTLNRYWGPDTVGAKTETRDRWRGIVTLKSLDRNGIFKTIQTIDSVDFLDRDYIKELKAPIRKAFSVAETLTNFYKAENQIIEFCNFKTDCQILDLKTDTTNNKLSIITADKKVIEIKYPKTILEESEQSGGIQNQTFKMNSIRKIKIGKINLIAVDFASGEMQNTELDRQTSNQQQCSSPTDCIYPEIVLYHGQSFDTIIWN